MQYQELLYFFREGIQRVIGFRNIRTERGKVRARSKCVPRQAPPTALNNYTETRTFALLSPNLMV